MTDTDDRRQSGANVFAYTREALTLVAQTSKPLTVALAALTLVAGLLPAAMAWVGQLIIDSVVATIDGRAQLDTVLRWVALEGGLVLSLAGAQRGLSLCQSLLRAQLGHRVNMMILNKAQTLDVAQFEDAEFYDKLTRARRDASARPLGLVNKTFALIRNAVSLIGYAALLVQFSIWAVALLLLAGIPSFIAETRFSGDAFRLFRWRSPDSRMQMYLETVLAREDHVKEVRLFGLGPMFLKRYQEIFKRLFAEDRALAIRRETWGFVLGIISIAALYGTYAWIVTATVDARITLGAMTMYLLVFRQGQAAVSASLASISGMYEDNLYLSTLYEYLQQPTTRTDGHMRAGALPGDGLHIDAVSFTYPGTTQAVLRDFSLRVRPGESLALVGANGAGKTTLIKLLTGLYPPDTGHIRLDGTDLADWEPAALRARFGVIFQDFARYQLSVGENIGTGDVAAFEARERWHAAARLGMASDFIDQLREQYDTQLGRWFAQGQELSVGQWQKIALSRAFMRTDADILILDEPTAAMDAAAEAELFEHFRARTEDKITILISHRFSTVRRANRIVVLEEGQIVEEGSHVELMSANGLYARLFTLQAEGYR